MHRRSLEYVTFWADLNNNGYFEKCLGTASVRVHDIQNVPEEGLEYSVHLPVDLGVYKRPCQEGPRVIPIRAILSWNSPAPCPFPNKAPVWGNREDTLIMLPPGTATVPGNYEPLLTNISGFAACQIDQASGFAPGDRPFGQALFIIGDIPAANTLPTANRLKYKVQVRPVTSPVWQTLTNDFGVWVEEQLGVGNFTQSPHTQSVDGDERYTYLEYGIGTNMWRRVVSQYPSLLAVWFTGEPMTGRWEIRVMAYDTLNPGPVYFAQTTVCPDGTARQNVIVKLDEVKPTADITITHYSTDHGANWLPAAACGDFVKGVWIKGQYSVSDEHFGSLSLTVQPSVQANGAVVNPQSRSYGVVPTGGETGTWTLDTNPMEACGYVVRLDASDRTVVSGGGGWQNFATVGFCLRAAPSA